tara:strand:+ start:305 stop:1558 length:1254 start_codon:yes stop_codon:yes gene_type:complete
MKKLFFKLWPINRSITGSGVSETLMIIRKYIGYLQVKNYKTGDKAFDWKIPEQWEVKEAYILNPDGKKICDYKKNNLHVVGYSKKIKKYLSLDLLKKKLYTIKKIRNAIPYITSYYKKDWGFCISYNEYKNLKKGKYLALINARHFKGKLSYGEFFKKGSDSREIFFSCNVCHPSLANNELSGPVVMAHIAKWIKNINTKYSYRIVFIPETIGSISYISKNLKKMKEKIIAGYTVTCAGDEENYSFLPSKNKSLSNQFATELFKENNIPFKKFSWLDRGSDERQYCSPNVDLPIASLMRTKYNEYPEYHTSLDKFGQTVTLKGLNQTFNLLKKLIIKIEKEKIPLCNTYCEPFMTKYQMYPTTSTKIQKKKTSAIMNILSYCDNRNTIKNISTSTNIEIKETKRILKILKQKKIVTY